MCHVLQWTVLPLLDNYDEDKFEYELHVHTGFARHSATKSKVFFKLDGTEGETGIRSMPDGIRKVDNIGNKKSALIW